MIQPGFTCHLLDAAAYQAADDRRMALARHRDDARGAGMHEVVDPCAMWFAPWYFDPADPQDAIKRTVALRAIEIGTFGNQHYYLSRHYWTSWSDKRAPICVLCPNGKEWCPDAISNNGDGWTVTGDAPRITVTPSIVVPGYHGFLKDGVFTPNI